MRCPRNRVNFKELLNLDADTLLRRLYWEEDLRRFKPLQPRFACRCSRERVRGMLRGLGAEEVNGIIAERGEVEIGCEFCGLQYRFDAVDVGELFTPERDQPPGSGALQ
jgi:molecular chaperone Hsp33